MDAIVECLQSLYDEEGGPLVEQGHGGHQFRVSILNVLRYSIDVESEFCAEEFHLANLVDEEEALLFLEDRRGDSVEFLHVHAVFAQLIDSLEIQVEGGLLQRPGQHPTHPIESHDIESDTRVVGVCELLRVESLGLYVVFADVLGYLLN